MWLILANSCEFVQSHLNILERFAFVPVMLDITLYKCQDSESCEIERKKIIVMKNDGA